MTISTSWLLLLSLIRPSGLPLYRAVLDPPARAVAAAQATQHADSNQLSGTWQAQMTGEGKTYTWTFHFTATGATLTGTAEISDRRFVIADGRIKGNNVSFSAFGNWTGTLVGSELNLTRGLDYGKKQYMVAHRTAK